LRPLPPLLPPPGRSDCLPDPAPSDPLPSDPLPPDPLPPDPIPSGPPPRCWRAPRRLAEAVWASVPAASASATAPS